MKDKEDRKGPLGPLEAEVMKIMWSTGEPFTVRSLLGRINQRRTQPLAYTTVMTVMGRLVEKDVLRRRREGRGYVYETKASDPAEIAVRSVMRDFGDAALAHFVEEARADPKAMRRLQRLLADEA
jgi:predicted transcriptional regulator